MCRTGILLLSLKCFISYSWKCGNLEDQRRQNYLYIAKVWLPMGPQVMFNRFLLLIRHPEDQHSCQEQLTGARCVVLDGILYNGIVTGKGQTPNGMCGFQFPLYGISLTADCTIIYGYLEIMLGWIFQAKRRCLPTDVKWCIIQHRWKLDSFWGW